MIAFHLAEDDLTGTQWLIILGIIAAIVILGAILGGTKLRLGDRTFTSWRDLLDALAHGTGLEAFPAERDLDATVEGTIEGRRATIRWQVVGKRENEEQIYRYTVYEVPCDAAFKLRVTEETFETRAAKVLGTGDDIRIGRPVFDDRFYVEGSEPRKLKHAMRGGLAEAVQAAFGFGAFEFVISEGVLRVRLPFEKSLQLSARRHKDLLELLAAAAASFDRVEIKVANLGERKALRGRATIGRCAYCHADVTGLEPDLDACRTCSTILHQGCWDELARCPVLGCTGDRHERGDPIARR